MSDSKVHGHNNYDKCLTMVSASTFIILFEPIKLYERGRTSIRSLYRQWNAGSDSHRAGKWQGNVLSLDLLTLVHTFVILYRKSHDAWVLEKTWHGTFCEGRHKVPCSALYLAWGTVGIIKRVQKYCSESFYLLEPDFSGSLISRIATSQIYCLGQKSEYVWMFTSSAGLANYEGFTLV